MTQIQQQPGTALPWRVEDETTLIWGDCNPDDHSTRGMGYPIAEAKINPSGNWSTGPYADEGEANARYIVTAANAYPKLLAQRDELVAALKEARVVVEAVVDLARNSSGKIAYAGRATSAAANLLTRIDSALANARQGEEG